MTLEVRCIKVNPKVPTIVSNSESIMCDSLSTMSSLGDIDVIASTMPAVKARANNRVIATMLFGFTSE